MAEKKIRKQTTKKQIEKPVKKSDGFILSVLNKSAEASGKIALPKEIFGQKLNLPLLAQAARVYLDNQKPSTASVKTRAEVSGGGRKPWRQKGTGRARVGSIRVPNWRGGGVVFGPTNDKRKLYLPEKMRRKALSVALSDRFKENAIVVFEKFDFKQTKEAARLLDKTPIKEKKNLLIVLESGDQKSTKALRNIKNLKMVRGLDLNSLDVVESSGLILTLNSLEELKNRFKIKVEGKRDDK